MEYFNAWMSTASIMATVVGTVFWLSWWLSNQFKDVRNLVYNKTEQLQNFFLSKMEYHEKHDDARFQSLSNDLWIIKLRNAAKDGVVNGITPKKEEK